MRGFGLLYFGYKIFGIAPKEKSCVTLNIFKPNVIAFVLLQRTAHVKAG
jgi:hypothetical protein